MRIKFLILWLILVIFPVFAHGKVADLKPCDVHSKINEFLYNHIYHKRLSKDIMRRAIGNCIDHLDPMKSYFTREELSAWLDPTDELLELTLNAFYKSDFSTFEEIYRKMLSSIERRSLFEDEIDKMKPLSKITIKDINDKEWCSTPQDLKEKLYKIRSIQSKYAKKLDPDFQNKFFVVLKKRRAWREQEIAGVKKEEQDPIIYTYILKSIAAALDSQTDYFPPDEAKMMMQQVQQRMLGVGVRLIDDITGFKVVDLVEGGPAIKQGELQVDDKIVAVDNEPVVGMDIQQAVHLIQGKENTPVKLTILRELKDENEKAETLDITITRGNIVVEESRLESFLEPFADGVIAHIILHGFYQDPNSSSAEDLFNKISDIKENNNLKGIILDLRNNSGGLLVQGVAISSFFIGKGIVASTKQYDGTLLHFRNEQSNIIWDGPLVVLMNKASASSAEIVAQSLQDYGRALIVGDTQSFGKGSYQVTSILPNHSTVDPKGEYKITQGMYYTVSGKTPQLVGVPSDIVVPGYLAEIEYGERFSKYPVPNNSIEENYNDKLSDVLPWNRSHYKKNYLNNLQTKMLTFSKNLQTLKENSIKRVKENRDYQYFLKGLKDESESEEAHFAQNDLQFLETLNIIKDMIYLYDLEQKKAG
ncbi:MAG: hypothetical protein S4CHLAM6_01540 [Chlamydiae bacterium]|nr:hypothetical protein [Chlamydiota bacterium]